MAVGRFKSLAYNSQKETNLIKIVLKYYDGYVQVTLIKFPNFFDIHNLVSVTLFNAWHYLL